MSVTIRPHEHGATIAVRAQPGAKKTAVLGEWNGMLKVAVAAPPEGGRVNEAIADVLKDMLGVRRSRIELIAGPSNRAKVFLIHDATVEFLTSRTAIHSGG